MTREINPCGAGARPPAAGQQSEPKSHGQLLFEAQLVHGLFDQSPCSMILFMGPDHIVQAANPAYFAFTGLTPDILGKPARQGLKRGYSRGFGALLDMVFGTGEARQLRGASLLVNRTPGGPDEEAFGDFVLQPIRDQAGQVMGIFCQGHEVTHELRSREALEASRDALERALDEMQIILDHSHDVICVADDEGRCTRVSRQGEAMWGYPPEELLDRPFVDLIHPDDREATLAMGQLVRAGTPTSAFLNRVLHKDGTIVPMMWSASYCAARGANICIGRDMREHLAAEERLRQAQKMEAIGRLTGGVAHDFNNLLAVVIGSAEALADALHDRPEVQQLADVALNAAERGADLVSRLLAFARSQPLAPQRVDCARFFEGLKPMLERVLGRGVRIDVVAGADLACLADRSQLASAVLNLCINARDAMPAGGRIVLRAQAAATDPSGPCHVALSVEDDGEGMGPEVRARALEPFFTTKPEGQGSGLGLSMVHGFVAQSDGRLEICSEPGCGTQVRMWLPSARGSAASCNAAPPPCRPPPAAYVMLVEDDTALRAQVGRQLRDLGMTVTTHADAAAALDALAAGAEPDLLFTDVVMPGGMNGLQLADRARRLRPDLRVLFTTGHADEATLGAILAWRRDGLLAKPYRRDDLTRAVRQVFEADVAAPAPVPSA
jgi:PAS domain S-box-containing protein